MGSWFEHTINMNHPLSFWLSIQEKNNKVLLPYYSCSFKLQSEKKQHGHSDQPPFPAPHSSWHLKHQRKTLKYGLLVKGGGRYASRHKPNGVQIVPFCSDFRRAFKKFTIGFQSSVTMKFELCNFRKAL